MKPSSVLGFVTFLFLVGASSATSQSGCTSFTLPNFLNIGQCLGTTGNICNSTQGAAQTIVQLLNCTITGITKFNIGTQIALLESIFTSVLSSAGLGYIADVIYAACHSLFGIVPLINCNALQLGNATSCDSPITLSFPNALNLGKCVSLSVPVCNPGQALSTSALTGYFNILMCLVQAALNTNADDIVSQLVCTSLQALYQILGPLSKFLQVIIAAITSGLSLQGCN